MTHPQGRGGTGGYGGSGQDPFFSRRARSAPPNTFICIASMPRCALSSAHLDHASACLAPRRARATASGCAWALRGLSMARAQRSSAPIGGVLVSCILPPHSGHRPARACLSLLQATGRGTTATGGLGAPAAALPDPARGLRGCEILAAAGWRSQCGPL